MKLITSTKFRNSYTKEKRSKDQKMQDLSKYCL